MDTMVTLLNTIGKSFVGFSTSMLIQSSVLIIVLLVLDLFLRKKVRAVFRSCIWMLVLVKLVLPTTLSSPTGLGYWFGEKVPSFVTEKSSSIPKQMGSTLQRTKPESETIPYGLKITDLSSFGTSPEPIAGTSAKFTVAASPAAASLSWQGFAFLGWLTVVVAMILLLIRRMFFVRGLLAQSKNPNDSMVDIFERCREQMGVHRPIFLKLSPVAACPSVCGLFRPTILFPQNLPRKLKAGGLRSVLLHELAHIKRGDLWVGLIQTILQIAYFYNPLLWVANVIIRKVREQAVDEMVLVAMGEKAEDYPETLLNISRMTFGRPALNFRLIGVIESKKALERRIMNMLNRPVPKSSKLGICGLIVIVVIGAVILPMGYNPTEQTALAASFMKDRSVGGIIVPGVRVGDYTFGMSKDEVLRKLGEPETIFYGGQRYTLDNLPRRYFMSFGDVSFMIDGDAVAGIGVHSPLYKFTNGLGVGDSEEEIKRTFGDNFQFREGKGKDFLNYKDKGLHFEISKKDRTVMEIGVSPIESSKSYKRADIVGKTIVPGLRIGDYTVGMRKDEVLRKLGEPKSIQLEEDGELIHRGEENYNLNNLPSEYLMVFGDISFLFHDESVKVIFVSSPDYKLSNGLKVGDSEQKVKQVFGEDFKLEKAMGKDFHCYLDRGLAFEIREKNQTVAQIVVYKPEGNRGGRVEPDQQEYSKNIIVPGLRVGEYTVGMSKDEVLEELGEPESIQLEEDGEVIHRGEENYDLNNRECLMIYSDISFGIEEDSVEVIMVRSPLYKLSNGLIVGDSEHKVKQAFGKEFKLEEALGKVFRCYHAKGLAFEIHKNTQTIAEIVVYKPEGSRDDRDAPDRQEHSKHTIVPGLRVGEYTLGMSKDEVLRKLGEPETIFYGGQRYTLDNLPRRYFMSFGDVSFMIEDDTVTGIGVHSSRYKFTNGLGVGDSEEKIKRTFGYNFHLKEGQRRDFLTYEDKGLHFEISNKDRKVIEIGISRTADDRVDSDAPDQQEKSKHTIVPGVRVGVYTFDMSKDEVLRKLGEPDSIQLEEDEVIHRGDPKYSLNNLSSDCILAFGDISFLIKDDSVKAIFVRSPLYKLSNGLKVGDSEQKIKQAFGEDFHLEESLGKDYLCYDAKWLAFEINKKNQTVAEIVTFQPKVDRPDSAQVALVRKAASEGRILYKVTTPDEFKEIAGQPTREWTDGDDVIYMEYPGIEVKFVCRGNSPYVVIYVLCNRMGIDIGQDRPIDEGDLDQQPDRSDRDTPDSDKIIMLSEQPPGPITFPKIDRHPDGGDFGRGALESLPRHNPKSTENWQVDLRGRDVSRLDLRKSLDDLLYADFDSRTTWPTADHMPEGFDQERIMELGKNPGLGVRKVHERGITGRGVGIAIVDQPLLTKHQEYANRLRLYEEINVKPGSDASMHGAAVASIAVGKTVGVAPEADLYYIGSWTGDRGKGAAGFEWNFAYYAQAVRRILAINKQLPDDRKIRVISISVGWSLKRKGYDEMTAAVEEAKKAGMLVVCSCIDDVHGFVFDGLNRAPMSDPDDFASCEPGLWLAEGFYRGQRKWNQLWVPMGSRTTAAPNGIDEYVFYRQSGWSWAIPYVAGVYALAAQVDPEITAERFWKLAMKTGRTVEVEHQGRKYELGPIADPGALIDSLEDN